MKLNADFSKSVIMHGAQMPWVDSPIAGVKRRMLDRVGDEVARATSIVKYDPGSEFSPHIHTGGEEFVVLEGVFQDEHGDFPAGSYIRNPPESRHTPGSQEGCVIFVKLWQFDLHDRTHVRLNHEKMGRLAGGNQSNIEITPLYEDEFETVQIEHWPANSKVSIESNEGAEVLVLEGSFTVDNDELTYLSWLRIPIADAPTHVSVGSQGAKIWKKSRHLTNIQPLPSA